MKLDFIKESIRDSVQNAIQTKINPQNNQLDESSMLEIINQLIPVFLVAGGTSMLVNYLRTKFNLKQLSKYYERAGLDFSRINTLIEGLEGSGLNFGSVRGRKGAAEMIQDEASDLERKLSNVEREISRAGDESALEKWTSKVEPQIRKSLAKIRKEYRPEKYSD